MKDRTGFDREHLQDIRHTAESLASVAGTSSRWKRMWLRLADAASEADAYIARTIIVKEGRGENGKYKRTKT